MNQLSTRVLTGATILILTWGIVYWLWEPGPSDAVPMAALAPEGAPIETATSQIVDPLLRRDAEPTPRTQAIPSRAEGRRPVDADVRTPRTTPQTTPRNAARSDEIAAETVETEKPTPSTVVPPRFREVTVRDGDTFERIARREFGSIGMVDVVARANPRVDPRRLRIGMVLRIPLDPSNIQGKPVEGAERPSRPIATPLREYVVSSGDTLSGISQRFYGSSRFTRELYEANRDVMPDIDSLGIGMTLKIPELSADD